MGKLYVGNLPFSATDDDLKAHFEQIGPVDSAKVIKDFSADKENGRSKGYGFVTMEDSDKAMEELNDKKEYTRAFFLHGRSVYLAEALAAYIHGRIREEMKLEKGQGKRYSPGYPLWKDLSDQKKVFQLLDITNRIGVSLTEEFQMVPEQSTTAMIVYHGSAEY